MGSQNFTPSWTAVTSNPSVVSGRLTGRYVAIGKRMMATYHLYLDGDDNLGSGAWRFSLPFPPQSGMHYFGTGIVIHPSTASGGHSPSICRAWIPDGQTTVRLFGQLDTAEWGPTVPHTWNGGDTLNFTISYTID